MGVIYKHIKDNELPVLLRVCYEKNNRDIESGYTMLSEIPDSEAEQWLKEKK